MYAHSNKKEKIQVLYKVKSSSYSEQKINTKKKKIKMEYIPHTSKEVIDPSTERTIPHHLWKQVLGHTQIVCSQIIGPEKHQFSAIEGKACNIWTNLYTSITSYRFQTYIYTITYAYVTCGCAYTWNGKCADCFTRWKLKIACAITTIYLPSPKLRAFSAKFCNQSDSGTMVTSGCSLINILCSLIK